MHIKGKKIISLLLCLFIIAGCFVLGGCGEDENEDNTNVVDPTPEPTPDPEVPSIPTLYQITPDTCMLMMCYVIKTTNNKLIVIDGGGVDTREQNRGYLYEELQRISGKEVPEIEAWFLTHLHDDHLTEFALIAMDAEKEIIVNNIYFNFPSREFMERVEGGRFAYLYDDMKASYDRFFGEGAFDAAGGKTVKKGDVIDIDGVSIEILYTVSDKENESHINDTSLIFRATIEGQTVLFLGDAATGEENKLVTELRKTHGREYIKSDIVQMSHHGQGGVSRSFYRIVDPTLCLWPSPDWVFNNTNGNLQTLVVREWMIDLGVEYHLVTGLSGTQSLTFPVDFSKLEPLDITPD